MVGLQESKLNAVKYIAKYLNTIMFIMDLFGSLWDFNTVVSLAGR